MQAPSKTLPSLVQIAPSNSSPMVFAKAQVNQTIEGRPVEAAIDSAPDNPPRHPDFALPQPQAPGSETQKLPITTSPMASPENMVSVPASSTASADASMSAPMLDCFPPGTRRKDPVVDDFDTDDRTTINMNESRPLRVPEDELRPLFVETYFEYCYAWCPIFNDTSVFQELQDSPLLDNAMATLGTNLRPPMLPHRTASTYYDQACQKFHGNEEPNLMPSLKSLMLFYWWAPQEPSVMNRNSSWWWTSVVIRHAQQAGIHNDYNPSPSDTEHDPGLHRRLWWTVFSRERLTAICQGKPYMIDPEDCDIPPLSLADFPDSCDKKKAEVFIYWVRLCAIIGRIAKEFLRSAKPSLPTPTFPTHLAGELIDWVRSLPPYLQLPIGTSHTLKYDRDVHQLHLTYLAIIVVLHITRPLQSLSAPKALTPAMVAAACIARILKDVLIRGEIRCLMPITCWYSGMAFAALLQGSRIERLRDDANANLLIITNVISGLKDTWGTANVYDKGFEKFRTFDKSVNVDDFPNCYILNERAVRPMSSEESATGNGIDWLEYFPFVTAETSPLVAKLLDQPDVDDFHWENFCDFSAIQLHDLVGDFGGWADPALLF
ncbi:hypothetical protein LTR96_011123 [Exophiala xenobiotica]|nr:hypothetical protein LTR41_011262 [Exophiala xenobiotica]KAK5215784.1 hypothetical protein LTR72_011198 [Exophiala xenobiotica]KAK5220897.1 hypothetical protein LTR47_011053 [Exophiala xenobiotica]KAK5245540.1 hypothetical protein LTS06_009062 [Exophiala xenobiotica]KAK5263489.1 hypothetical protein LTR96_011123 [Exophiala xenobiotica]